MKLNEKIPDPKDNYHKERYIRIALAYKQFVMHDDINPSFVFLQSIQEKEIKYLNKGIIDKIFEFILKESNANISVNSSVFQLDGDDYDFKKKKIVNKLSEGQKLFVISVYQTIGAGQNLQYEIPSGTRKRTDHHQ